MVLHTVCKINNFRLILNGNKPEGLTRQGRRRRRRKKKKDEEEEGEDCRLIKFCENGDESSIFMKGFFLLNQ